MNGQTGKLVGDLPVSGIGAQGQHGQRRHLKGGVKGRLRERLHLGKALREGREGKGFPLVSDGCGCRRDVYKRQV